MLLESAIDKNGIYSGERGVHNPGKEGYRYDIIHPNTKKPCKQPLMGYRFPEDTMNKMISEGRIIFGQTEDKLVEIKVYAKDYQQKFSSVINLDGRAGANELKELFPNEKKIFTNPKTIKLLEDLISFSSNENSLILDFFAGSGTTAHAVMQLNAEDGGNRQFICVQLDEKTDPKKEAYKAGYKSIFDITKARIQKAAQKIQTEHPNYTGDLGFKLFKTVPIFEDYQQTIAQFDPNLALFDGTQLNPQQLADLLTTWQIQHNIPLNHTLNTLDLGGYTAHWFNDILYLMTQGFESAHLKAFIEKLDADSHFTITKVVLFGYNINSKMQREIDEGLKNYRNKKSITLDVVVKY